MDLEESPLANQKRGKYEGTGAAPVARLQGHDRATSHLRRPIQARFIRMHPRARPLPGPTPPLRKWQSLSNAFSSREREHGKLPSDQKATFWWPCHCKVSEDQDKSELLWPQPGACWTALLQHCLLPEHRNPECKDDCSCKPQTANLRIKGSHFAGFHLRSSVILLYHQRPERR